MVHGSREGQFAEWCLLGARMGRLYANDDHKDREALMKINDWTWLREQFDDAQNTRSSDH
jgi:hypothetical protein